MATKKTPSVTMTKEDAPKTLKKHIFYGLNLDEKQEALRDALWDEADSYTHLDVYKRQSMDRGSSLLIAILSAR